MKELETMKGRELVLNLSDADCERIFAKAAGVGLTVPQLLENFVSDLVYGTVRNGSDEHMYAERWFDRCGFEMLKEQTFVQYMLDDFSGCYMSVEPLLETLDELQALNEELDAAKSNPEDYMPEDLCAMREDLTCLQHEIDEVFHGFERWAKLDAPVDRTEAINTLRQWQAEKERFMRGIQANVVPSPDGKALSENFIQPDPQPEAAYEMEPF